jgi:hypothetical protein
LTGISGFRPIGFCENRNAQVGIHAIEILPPIKTLLNNVYIGLKCKIAADGNINTEIVMGLIPQYDPSIPKSRM